MKHLIWLLCLLTACTSKPDTSLKTLNVPLSSKVSSVNLSKVSSSVECIPLGVNDSTIVMDEVNGVILRDQSIYVSDAHALYKFDLSGNLQAAIRHQGEAPDDYMMITDFQLDEDGMPWILCPTNKAMYKYNWDGSLLQKIKLNSQANKMHFLGQHKMLLYMSNEKDENNQNQLRVLNLQDGKAIREELPIDDYKSTYLHIMSGNPFSAGMGECSFYQMFCDTIYSVSKEGAVTPNYLLDFEGKNIPASFYRQKYLDIMDFFQNLFKEDYAYGVGLFMKEGDSCWLSFCYNKHVYWAMNKGEEHVVSNSLVDDVCLSGYKIALDDATVFVQDHGEVIIPLSPYLVMEYIKEHQDERIQKKVGNLMKYVGEDQNPVLLKIRM